VSVWVAVTVTPGSTALLSSVTRPLNCAVDKLRQRNRAGKKKAE
jgi:hypothetical protein